MFKKTTSFLLLLLGSATAQANVTEVGLTPGEFRVDESGAATYNIPLNLPAGRAGVKPQLGLAYSSNNVMDGPLGVGWSLTGMSSISRCPMTPVHDGDIREVTFQDGTDEDGRGLDKYCLDGQRLLLKSGTYGAADSTYYTEVDNFSIITAHGQATTTGPLYFTVENKAGETHYYGDVSTVSGVSDALTTESLSSTDAFVEPGGYTAGSVAKSWAVKVIKDVKDNFIVYNYSKPFDRDNLSLGRFNLSNIKYTGNIAEGDRTFATVSIVYTSHNKPFKGYMAGSNVARMNLMSSISVIVDGELFRTYTPTYENSEVLEERTLMTSLQECVSGNECLSPTVFDWQRPDLAANASFKGYEAFPTLNQGVLNASNFATTQVFDINGDGFQDYIYEDKDKWYVRSGKTSFGVIEIANVGTEKPEHALSIDYNNDGVRELLVAHKHTEIEHEGYNNDVHYNWWVASIPQSLNSNCESENNCIGSQRNSFLGEQVDLGLTAFGWEGEAQVLDVNGDGFEDIVFRRDAILRAYLSNGDGTFGTGLGVDDNDGSIILLQLGSDVESVGINDGITTQSTALKYASALDINGDGRSDLIAKIKSDTSYCSYDRAIPTKSECEQDYYEGDPDAESPWIRGVVSTEYKLLKAVGHMDEPKYEIMQTIADAADIDTLRIADFNGDGLSDLVYVTSNDYWNYRLSNGIEFLPKVQTPIKTSDTRKVLTQFVDVNGDGKSDFLNASSVSNWHVYISKPNSLNNQVVFTQRGEQRFKENGHIRFGDVTGDGKLDLLIGGDDLWKSYSKRPNIKEYTINRITNGHGIYTDIEYKPMTDQSVYFFQDSDNLLDEQTFSPMSAMQLVSSVSTLSHDETITETRTVTSYDNQGEAYTEQIVLNWPSELTVNYQYGGLLVHKNGRGSLGFQMLKTLDAQTGVITETQYNQDYGPNSFATARMPEFTRQSKGGEILSEAKNTLRVKRISGRGWFPYTYKSNETSFVYGTDNTSQAIASTETTNTYDDWGNLTASVVKVTDTGTSQTLTTTTNNNFGNAEQQRLGRLQSTSVNKSGSNRAAIIRNSEFEYYGEDGLGLLKSSTVAPGKDNELITAYSYDAYGNKTTVSVTGNQYEKSNKQTRTTTTRYGSNGRFVDSVSNSLGHNVTYSYDGFPANSARGVINQVKKTDANGQHSTSHMNDFGRTTHTTSSVSQATKYMESWYCTDSRADCLNIDNSYYVTIEKETSSSNTAISPEKQAVYDRFGRVLLTRAKNLDGTWVTQKTEYDYRGRQHRVYEPGSNTYYTETHYLDDGIGLVEKMSRQTMYGMTEVLHHVNGLVKTTTDELGRESIVFSNGFGETAKTQDALNNTVEFVYDAYGNLKSSTTTVTGVNAGTNVVSTNYDDYGRKLETIDPIKGTWEYTYNAFGEIYTQKNARGEMFEFYYDVLGRKVKSYNPGEGTLCWYYDGTVAEQAVGKLIATAKFGRGVQNSCSSFTTSGTSIAKEYTYNAKGLSDTVTTTIGSDEYLQSQTYDDFARPVTTFYPEVADTRYSTTNVYENGFLIAVRDADGNLKTFDSMTERGQLETVTYRNGYEVTNAYRADNGWLESRLTKDNSGAFQQQMYLTYYDNGNVDTRQSVYGATQGSSGIVHDYTETYSYDKLNRLTLREIDVVTGQSLPTQFNEDQTFDYDGWGNFTFKEGVGYYKYSQSDVHRLLGVYSDESHTPGNEVYNFNNQYDANGNILSDGNRNFEYSSFDKVERITKNDDSASSVMHYGTDRQMYYKDDCFTTREGAVRTQTTYLGNFEKVERSNTSGEPDTNFTEYKYYVGGDIVITQREGKDDTTHYLHKDNLGSVVAVSDQAGEIVTQAIYDPWGKRSEIYTETASAALQVAAITDRGFTGHKHIEALDIIHMKGRIYDSTLGRFMQADPHIQAPLNLQNHNRYSYVLNNPMSYTDPSGYFFKKLFKAIGSNKFLSTFISAVLYLVPGCQSGLCTAAFNAAVSYAVTGSLKAAAIGFAAGAISPGGFDPSSFLIRGAIGGLANRALGGNFGHGFVSAGVGGAAGGIENPWGRMLVSAAIGGTVSKLTGGKFANGAVSAAFATAVQAGLNGEFSRSEGFWGENGDSILINDPDNHGKEMSLYDGKVKLSKWGSKEAKLNFKELGTVKSDLGKIFGTEEGAKMLDALSTDEPLKIMLNDKGVNAGARNERILTVDLSKRGYFKNMNSGNVVRVSTTRLFAHEMGHAISGHGDPRSVNTLWTDVIMGQINQTSRRSYRNYCATELLC